MTSPVACRYFCEATDNPVVTSALSFKARVDPLLACIMVCIILRFNSGVTTADTSMDSIRC